MVDRYTFVVRQPDIGVSFEIRPDGEFVPAVDYDALAARLAEHEIAAADSRRLVRELDVLLNGEAGAAEQASLCDIVAQVARTPNLFARLSKAEAVLRACDSTFSDLLDTLDHDENCPWWDDSPAVRGWTQCGCWQRGVEIMSSNVREVLAGQADAFPPAPDSTHGDQA